VVRKTPLIPSDRLSRLLGAEVYLKLENLQLTGTFKARGAANKLLALTQEEKSRGVIAFSTGNHGRAVAYISKTLGIPSVICLSERVPAFRIEAMKALGAEVIAYGQSQDQAYAKALEVQKQRGLTMVAPFDDPYVLSGQGTIALEVFDQLPQTACFIVPLSGGGLLSGVALAAKAINIDVRIVGVSMEVAPAMIASLKAGKPVEIEEKDSLADALLGGIGLDNQYTFELTKRHISQYALVSEQQIGQAMARALIDERQVVEGSGAVGLAAIEAGKINEKGPVVVVVSGGNADIDSLLGLVNQYKNT
jgi:threonine dehydratase